MSNIPLSLVGVSALVPLTLAALYIKHLVTEGVRGGRGLIAALLLIVTVAATADVVWKVLVPGEVITHAELEIDGEAVSALPRRPVSLLVRGTLPPTSPGQALSGDYAVSITMAGQPAALFDGTLSKHYEDSRSGRPGAAKTLVSHLEERHDLPWQGSGATATLKVLQKEPPLKGPLILELVPAPPRAQDVAAAGLAVVFVGILLDSRAGRRKTYFSALIATFAAYATLYCHNVVPHGTYRPVVGVAMAAVPIGLAGGALLRAIALAILPKKKAG